MMITVAITLKNVDSHDRTVNGSKPSTVSMSRENLLRIRPIGVVSKNIIGERRMLASMRECRIREE